MQTLSSWVMCMFERGATFHSQRHHYYPSWLIQGHGEVCVYAKERLTWWACHSVVWRPHSVIVPERLPHEQPCHHDSLMHKQTHRHTHTYIVHTKNGIQLTHLLWRIELYFLEATRALIHSYISATVYTFSTLILKMTTEVHGKLTALQEYSVIHSMIPKL